jgi:hypothetical protein
VRKSLRAASTEENGDVWSTHDRSDSGQRGCLFGFVKQFTISKSYHCGNFFDAVNSLKIKDAVVYIEGIHGCDQKALRRLVPAKVKRKIKCCGGPAVHLSLDLNFDRLRRIDSGEIANVFIYNEEHCWVEADDFCSQITLHSALSETEVAEFCFRLGGLEYEFDIGENQF